MRRAELIADQPLNFIDMLSWDKTIWKQIYTINKLDVQKNRASSGVIFTVASEVSYLASGSIIFNFGEYEVYDNLNRCVLCLLTSGLCLILSCCCKVENKQPAMPSYSHAGWDRYEVGGIAVLGSFVLKKGESVSNGKIGIRIVGIYPDKCGAIAEIDQRRARFQMFRVSDNHILFDDEAAIGSVNTRKPYGSENEMEISQVYGISVVYIDAINTKYDWVALTLRGSLRVTKPNN